MPLFDFLSDKYRNLYLRRQVVRQLDARISYGNYRDLGAVVMSRVGHAKIKLWYGMIELS